MVKLQLALDTLNGEEALKLASLAAPFVDILEAGTPLIKSVGINIVAQLKSAHPDKIVLADLKSSDVGAYLQDLHIEEQINSCTRSLLRLCQINILFSYLFYPKDNSNFSV